MSDFLDRFEAQLVATRPPRRRLGRRAALGLSLIGLAVVGPAVAATAPWRPIIGDSRRGTPAAVQEAPPADEIAGMAVLRRPQTEADRGPLTREALRLTGRQVDGIHLRYVRLLRASAVSAVLMPVDRFNLESAKLIDVDTPERVKALLRVKPDGLCTYEADPRGDGGGGGCWTWTEVRNGTLPGSMGAVLSGLVPDGIDHVRVVLDGGAQLEADVHENFYAVSASSGETAPAAIRVTWFDSSGRAVRTIDQEKR